MLLKLFRQPVWLDAKTGEKTAKKLGMNDANFEKCREVFMNAEARQWIDRLGLVSHPEGGFYKETYGRPFNLLQCVNENQETSGDASSSSGTAFFITNKGHLLTNNHVVEGCELSKISFKNKDYDAKLIATDKTLDLALLKTNKSSPMYLSMSSKKPPLGTEIVVGGFPTAMNLGIGIKITKGIVSGSDTRYEFLDIIDAAIQQGSSGGPVINQSGNLVGVVVGTQLDQEGNTEQTLNFIVNWKTLKKFLKK